MEVKARSLEDALEFVKADAKRLETENKVVCGVLYDKKAEMPFVLISLRYWEEDDSPWYESTRFS